jgi:hypothetical protein
MEEKITELENKIDLINQDLNKKIQDLIDEEYED